MNIYLVLEELIVKKLAEIQDEIRSILCWINEISEVELHGKERRISSA